VVDETADSPEFEAPDPEERPQAIPEKALQQILAISRPAPFSKGEEVVFQGSQARALYYVEKGSVEVSYTVDGTKIVVALIGRGSFFGEIGFFDGVSRVRDIRAAEDSVIRIFEREQVQDLRRQDPDLYAQFVTFMARSICAKFRRVLEEREPLTAYAASLAAGRRTFTEPRPLPSRFFQTPEWRLASKIVETFKADFFDLCYKLQLDTSPEIAPDHRDKCNRMLDDFNEQLQDCQSRLDEPQTGDYVWGFVFKEIFPYFMRSRFAERAYFKPKGYAGDYLMMEMIYQNQPTGDGKLGVLVDGWCLNTAAAKAVRGRRELLSRRLEAWSRERLTSGDRIRIMNLACGSNRELFDFLGAFDSTEEIEAVCIDVDQEALEYTNRQVNVFSHRASVRLMQDDVVKWSLGRVRHNLGLHDIIYSAGLTDYLDRRLFQALASRCFEHLKPGGIFVIGNFGANNPNRVFMDQILHWNLIHREEKELKDLFAETPFGENVEVLSEEQKINLFAVGFKVA